MWRFLALVLILMPGFCKAQVVEDFGLWGTVSYNKSISKKYDVSIDQEIRMEDNARSVGRVFTNLGIDYKLKKWVRFGGNYRLIFDRRIDGSYGVRHRLTGDAVLKTRARRFSFAYRARFQWEVKTYNYSDRYGFAPSWDVRNRLKLNYKINRAVAPYISLDVRVSIDDPRTPYLQGVDRIRIVGGVDWRLSETQVIDLYFVTSEQVQLIEPKRIYAIGIAFNLGSARPLLGS